MSNTGKWNDWYKDDDVIRHYGDGTAYQKGADFLEDVDMVEDWGCGQGAMRKFIPAEKYVGLDGSKSGFADKVVDLEEYRSNVEGIFMRAVLEHNYEWKKVLENALSSFSKKMALILFTPFVDETHEVDFIEEIGVPDIAFRKEDLTDMFDKHNIKWELEDYIPTETYYGSEHIFYLTKQD